MVGGAALVLSPDMVGGERTQTKGVWLRQTVNERRVSVGGE
jgi:hypothetical protein